MFVLCVLYSLRFGRPESNFPVLFFSNYSMGSPVVLLTAVPISLSLVLFMIDPQVKEAMSEQDDFLQRLGLSASCVWQNEKMVHPSLPPSS